MPAQKKEFLNTARVILLGLPLFITACHSDFGPFPMPTGYKYHDKANKTPPGPEPIAKKIEHMKTPQSIDRPPAEVMDDAEEPVMETRMETDITEKRRVGIAMAEMDAEPAATAMMAPAKDWDQAAIDLVRRMAEQFGRPTEPIYIQPAITSEEIGLEKALRSALIGQGFELAQMPGMGPYTLSYAFTAPDMPTGRTMVKISLVGADGTVVTEHNGLYDTGGPAYPAPGSSAYYDPATMESDGAPMAIGPE